MERPAAAANSADNSSQLRIDEFFNDPLLLDLIDQGLASNRELQILDEEVQIASNEVKGAARGVPSVHHGRGQRGAGQTQQIHAGGGRRG